MTGPTFPPGLRRGPDCQVRIRNGRPSLVARVDRNPYRKATIATGLLAVAAGLAQLTAWGAPLSVALAGILWMLCAVLYVVHWARNA